MTLKPSLIASIKTGDFIKHTSKPHALPMGSIPAPEVITVRVGSFFQQQTVCYSSFKSVQFGAAPGLHQTKGISSGWGGEMLPRTAQTASMWTVYVFRSAKAFLWFYFIVIF